MATEAGEYIVGAYLQHFCDCPIILYNCRIPGGKLQGLNEVDVVGFNLKTRKAVLSEVTTHIAGLLYKNRDYTIAKIRDKHENQKRYAATMLEGFTATYQFWSPVVKDKAVIQALRGMEGLKIRINGDYKRAVQELVALARKNSHDMGNPVLRAMQIMEHIRDD